MASAAHAGDHEAQAPAAQLARLTIGRPSRAERAGGPAAGSGAVAQVGAHRAAR